MSISAEVGDAGDLDLEGGACGWRDFDWREDERNADAGWFGSKIAHAVSSAVSRAATTIAEHDPITRTIVAVAKGQNVAKSLVDAARTVGGDLQAIAPYAATISSLVPGLGTGVAAAIQAGSALAAGKGLSDSLVAGIKGALPGGAAAGAAFDAAMSIAKGGSVTDAALQTARAALPGGEDAKKAFDLAMAVAHGQNVQAAAMQQIAAVLPGGATGDAARALLQRVGSGQSMIDAAKAVGGDAAVKAAQGVIGPIGGELLTSLRSGTDVARSILARPELHGLPVTELAARLGVSPSLAGEGLSLATETVRKVASAPPAGVTSHDPIRIPSRATLPVRMGDSFDGMLSSVASRAAEPSQSPAPIPRSTLDRLHAWTRAALGAEPPAGAFPGFGSSVFRFHRTPRTAFHALHRTHRRRLHAAAGLDAGGKTYTVVSGDYPAKIAEQLTGSAGRYTELLDANPDKPQVRIYVRKNQNGDVVGYPSWPSNAKQPIVGTYANGDTLAFSSRNFTNLQPGDVLNLPASWVKSSPAPQPTDILATMTSQQVWQIKAILAAWGAKTGAINPRDYGGTDLVPPDAWTNRSHDATASYQAWANTQGEALRTDGNLDKATADSLIAWAARSSSIPTVATPVVTPVVTPALPVVTPQVPIATQPSGQGGLGVALAALAALAGGFI